MANHGLTGSDTLEGVDVMRFDGGAVVVTGAAHGIGRGIARAYLEEGARVAVWDFRAEALEEAVRTIDPEGSRTLAQTVDVRDARAVTAAMDAVMSWAPECAILVNAAGTYPSHPLLDMTESDWDAVLDTNLKGPLFTTQAFARHLAAHGRGGCVVNISSGSANSARIGAAHYATSKAGLNMLTRSMALELAPLGIRVNVVSPGYVEVNSAFNPLSQAYKDAISDGIPLGRPGRPDDIARAVLFLTGPESEWMTGSIVSVDGGSGAGRAHLPLSRPE